MRLLHPPSLISPPPIPSSRPPAATQPRQPGAPTTSRPTAVLAPSSEPERPRRLFPGSVFYKSPATPSSPSCSLWVQVEPLTSVTSARTKVAMER
ncbi:PREDICTED: predicted GPI-anchored protein 58 [Nipponia nippon]|uniref:predicted GPI-anchored protein 58 n=1 Tax=Nipponia nippon TaxID=128390 RepID=UPI000510DC9C|nr:PREDICTED: predicted GPI-anchored protein 58 [Nipponia nippon]